MHFYQFASLLVICLVKSCSVSHAIQLKLPKLDKCHPFNSEEMQLDESFNYVKTPITFKLNQPHLFLN